MDQNIKSLPRIRVVHIITRLDMGGSAYNTLETMARLDRNRYRPILVSGRTNDPHGEIKEILKKRNIHCVFINDLVRELNPWKDCKAFVKLFLLLRKGKFDLVHTHSSKAGILGRWAAWLVRTKHVVHTPHGHIFYGYFGKLLSRIFIYVERLTAKVTHKIITLTELGKQEHIKYKIDTPEKFVPIYSGIDVKNFINPAFERERYREMFNIPNGTVVIGSVARLDSIKNNRVLIEAMSHVVPKYPNVRALLVGDGEEREKLEEQVASLNLKEHVIFAGYRKDVSNMIQLMDIFVLCSLNEGMGRVILEAMVCGKPIIASQTGGIPELVKEGETGFLIEPGNIKGFSDAILKLISNKSKDQEMGQKAKKLASDHYSIESMVDKIDDLYCQLKKYS